MTGIAAISLIDLHKTYGLTPIIQGVSLQVLTGERHAIIGPNGAGKTTLFNLISGRVTPSAGRVLLGSRDVTGLPPHAINRLGLSRSFQVTSLFGRMSAFENLRCALLWSMGYRYSVWHLVDRQRRLNDAAAALIERLRLAHRRDVPAWALAYAEQRALEIGVTIAGGAQVILLDEPTAGMSRHESEQITALIREVTDGRTLVMVEHDMGVVFGLADRITVLVQGQVLVSGPPDAVRADHRVREAYLGQLEPV
jgi:branched-chain amino acid transport system ATP-binding protein